MNATQFHTLSRIRPRRDDATRAEIRQFVKAVDTQKVHEAVRRRPPPLEVGQREIVVRHGTLKYELAAAAPPATGPYVVIALRGTSGAQLRNNETGTTRLTPRATIISSKEREIG